MGMAQFGPGRVGGTLLRFGDGGFCYGGSDRALSALMAPILETGGGQAGFPSFAAMGSSTVFQPPFGEAVDWLAGPQECGGPAGQCLRFLALFTDRTSIRGGPVKVTGNLFPWHCFLR
jgi:hypothetical protein